MAVLGENKQFLIFTKDTLNPCLEYQLNFSVQDENVCLISVQDESLCLAGLGVV